MEGGVGASFGSILTGLATVVMTVTLLVILTVHTNTWSALTDNHLTDSEYSLITEGALVAQSIKPVPSGGDITFASDVIFDGDVSLGIDSNGTGLVARTTTRNLVVMEDITHLTEDGNTYSLVEQITNVVGECVADDALAALEVDAEAFANVVATESGNLTTCLPTNEAAMAAISAANEATNQNHTARMDALEAASCGGTTAQISNATAGLLPLDSELDAINATIVAQAAQMGGAINTTMNSIDTLLAMFSSATCNLNGTLLNNSIALEQSLSSQLAAILPVIATAQSSGGSCLATGAALTNLTTMYSAILTSAIARATVLESELASLQTSYASLNATYGAIPAVLAAQNLSMEAFIVDLVTYMNNASSLALQLNAQWLAYNALASTVTSEQADYSSTNTTFWSAYSQFNATYGACTTGVTLMNALRNSTDALTALFAIVYSTSQTSIANAQSFVSDLSNAMGDIAALEANIPTLQNDTASQNSTLQALASSQALVAASLALANGMLNDTQQVQYSAIQTLLAFLEASFPALSMLIPPENALAINTTALLVPQEARLVALETSLCFGGVLDSAVGITVDYIYTGSQSESKITTDIREPQQLPKFLGLSDVIDVIPFGGPNLQLGVRNMLDIHPSVVVDRNDHSYFVFNYKRSNDTGGTATVLGIPFGRNTTIVAKVSPINGMLWGATITLPGTVWNVTASEASTVFTTEDVVYIKERDSLVIVGRFRRYPNHPLPLSFTDATGETSYFLSPGTTAGTAAPPGGATETCVLAELTSTGHWMYAVQTDWVTNNGYCAPHHATAWSQYVMIAGMMRIDPVAPGTADFGNGVTLTQTGSLGQRVGGYARTFWATFDTTAGVFVSAQQFEYAGVNETFVGGTDVTMDGDGLGVAYIISLHMNNLTAMTTAGFLDYTVIAPLGIGQPNVSLVVDRGTRDINWSLLISKVDILTAATYWIEFYYSTSTFNPSPLYTVYQFRLTQGWSAGPRIPEEHVPSGSNGVVAVGSNGVLYFGVYRLASFVNDTYDVKVSLQALEFVSSTQTNSFATLGTSMDLWNVPRQSTTAGFYFLPNDVLFVTVIPSRDSRYLFVSVTEQPSYYQIYSYVRVWVVVSFGNSAGAQDDQTLYPMINDNELIIFGANNNGLLTAFSSATFNSTTGTYNPAFDGNAAVLAHVDMLSDQPLGVATYIPGKNVTISTMGTAIFDSKNIIPFTFSGYGDVEPGRTLYSRILDGGRISTRDIFNDARVGMWLSNDTMITFIRRPRRMQ